MPPATRVISPPLGVRGASPGALAHGRRAVLAAAIATICFPWTNNARPRPDGPVDRLLRELARTDAAPALGIPLSVRPNDLPCPARTLPGEVIPRSVCPAPPGASPASGRIAALVRNAAPRGAVAEDPRTLHTAALVELLWSRGAGAEMQRAIAYLEAAARTADRPAPVLADLAAALVVRAERTQTLSDLFEAVENGERAVRLEPGNAAARAVLAQALDRLGLNAAATVEWERFLQTDSTSAWAAEARRRIRALRATAPEPEAPAADARDSALARYAARFPNEARTHGWDHVLAGWATAVLDGDTAAAGHRLAFAERIGAALERRGGDASLADAARAIRAHARDADATRRLARAHAEYAAGRTAYRAGGRSAAARRLAAALSFRAPSPMLDAWAAQLLAAVRSGEPTREPERLARSVMEHTDARRHPALAAAARSALGSVLYRAGSYEPAIPEFAAAAALYERAGEGEMAGGARYLEADARFAVGQSDEAYRTARRAIEALRPNRASLALHSILSITAEQAARDGYLRAAARLQDECVAVARNGRPPDVAEALLWRARLRAAAGDLRGAEADLRAGEGVVSRMEEGREWGRTDLLVARAVVRLRSRPAAAAAAIDSALALPDVADLPIRNLQARVTRAQARLALRDAHGAAADLDAATALLARQRDEIMSAPLAASLLDAAREVFDQLAMLKVAEGHDAEALEVLERGRASFAAQDRRGTAAPERWSIPRGTVVVEYALIGDTLLAWTLAGTGVRLARRTVDRDALLATVARVRSALEDADTPEPELRPGLEALYGEMIRPVRARLGAPETRVVVIADGELSGIPFAALRDPASGRYLVQDHPIRFAGSVRDAVRPPRTRGAPAGKAVFVADPAFDAAANPRLPRLAHARAEADSAAAAYPTPRVVLRGVEATPAALDTALRHASLLHFAGHALFDDSRPDRSFLLLAPGPGDPSGRVTAADLAAMDLRGVRLVVLSACETVRTRAGRSGGFAGFAGAVLGAGADGLVASLWRVDDARTRALMTEFHRAYRASGDAPGALREAQLRLQGSNDPTLRSPAAWSGFRYAGS